MPDTVNRLDAVIEKKISQSKMNGGVLEAFLRNWNVTDAYQYGNFIVLLIEEENEEDRDSVHIVKVEQRDYESFKVAPKLDRSEYEEIIAQHFMEHAPESEARIVFDWACVLPVSDKEHAVVKLALNCQESFE